MKLASLFNLSLLRRRDAREGGITADENYGALDLIFPGGKDLDEDGERRSIDSAGVNLFVLAFIPFALPAAPAR
jgi:hypothetical protein